MIIKSLEIVDYRNYDSLNLEFDRGTNILYGDNAQGKTNILEAIYLAATTKSHRGTKDKEIINFDKEEAHIRTFLEKEEIETRVDMHLRKSGTKGIAIDGQRIKKAADLMGICNVVFFSPEDLGIIKNGPSERRRFVDMELCQLDSFYLYNLNHYNKIVNQRNKLLKDMYMNPDLKETLNIWDMQLVSFGSKIIERRKFFAEQLNEIIYDIHKKLSGGREEIRIVYEPDVEIEAGDLRLLTEGRLAGLVLGQPVPVRHLGGSQFFPALGNLLQRSPAGELGTRRNACRVTFQGKDATTAYLASRNALCRPRKTPESNGRKRYHE